MDDFAHLLLGFLIFKALRLYGRKIGNLELAAALLGSVAPDIAWSSGLVPQYAVSHVATYHVLLALPLLLSGKTRLAGACFALAATAHIVVDAFIHIGTWMPFYPLTIISIEGLLNYWEHWWVMAAYWLILLALLAAALYFEKKKTGKLQLV